MKRKRLLVVFLALLLAGGIAYWRLTAQPPSDPPGFAAVNPPTSVPGEARSETAEEKARKPLLGIWQDNYQGKRTMTLNEDGTGTMLVELSGMQAAMFASRLRFEMVWSFDGKKLTKKTIRGEPAEKVNLILNMMGNTAEDTLLEVSEDRLLLLDKDGKTRYDWRRVHKGEPGKE